MILNLLGSLTPAKGQTTNMWLKGLILALFLPTDNQSPVNQSIMAQFSWVYILM